MNSQKKRLDKKLDRLIMVKVRKKIVCMFKNLKNVDN